MSKLTKTIWIRSRVLILSAIYILVLMSGYYLGFSHHCGRINTEELIITTTESTIETKKISLRDIGLKYKTDKITWHHYDNLYDTYMSKYIGLNISLLEIGLGCGMVDGTGMSAHMWREYLGSSASIHYIEFDQQCGEAWFNEHGKKLNIRMHYGSQENVTFLRSVRSETGYFDIIIDDGGHTMTQQLISLEQLLPTVKSGGLYFIEDLQTSYMPSFGGGYLLNTTTIEFIKRLVDDLQETTMEKSTSLVYNILSIDIGSKICAIKLK